jgi:Zn-dependent protease
MFRSWKIGTMFGIGIYVHVTFLLLPAFVFLANSISGHIGLALFSALMIPVIFGCVVLHELGHALTARHYGIETHDITLYPIGGVARLEKLPRRPEEEFWIALAGPAVNVAIALFLISLLFLTGGVDLAAFKSLGAFLEAMMDNILGFLALANLSLAFFNMLPAFPMDGGRVLRALLATRIGQLQATIVATQIGIAMAVIFGVVGMLSNPMLAFVGLFVFFAGQQELAAVRYRSGRGYREPLDVQPAFEDEELDWPKPTPRGGFSGFTWDSGSDRWIEWRNGRPVHTISAR